MDINASSFKGNFLVKRGANLVTFPIMSKISEIIEESLSVKRSLFDQERILSSAADLMITCLRGGSKILICGNGGSAADSQHIAAELIGRYQRERRALPAIALSSDTSVLTAWANDYAYDTVFERQVRALAKAGDILWCLSTSGNSKNVLQAARAAKELGIRVFGMTGKNGGELGKLVDLHLNIPSPVTARVQESHILAYHIICELIDEAFAN